MASTKGVSFIRCICLNHSSNRLAEMDDLHRALEDVTKAVKNLIELYCRTYHTDFRFESVTNVVKGINISFKWHRFYVFIDYYLH